MTLLAGAIIEGADFRSAPIVLRHSKSSSMKIFRKL